MKITKIDSQRNKDRVNIYIDHEFAFGLDNEIRYKYKLFEGEIIKKEFIDTILQAEEQHKINLYALNLISYRKRSIKEIEDRLKQKGYEENHVYNAIEFCKSYGYLDDRSYAESYINDKRNLNNLGATRIRYELISKGVSKDIIEELLVVDDELEFEAAMEVALKRIPSYKNDDRNKKYRKLSGFLQRRGYSYNIVSKVMDKVLD